MRLLKHTDTHIYIFTNDKHQLKLANPGHKNKDELYKWLKIIAYDYDIMMKGNNKNA